jgi:magnesium-transporting ATPase (P-type)
MSKLALSATVEAQLKAFDLCFGNIECEQPNAATNKFAGNLHLSSSDAEAQRLIDGMGSVVPITIANVLMRGSSVRNTEYVLGLVVNTGVDTKVRPRPTHRPTHHLVPYLLPLPTLLPLTPHPPPSTPR